MSYVPGTQLERKEPLDSPAEDAPEGTPDLSVYNQIEIIGHSPVQRGVRSEQWGGQQGDEYSIRPLIEFGEVIDTPQGALERDYDVTFVPEIAQVTRERVVQTQPGPSPEDQFTAAQEQPSAAERVATPLGENAS